MSEQDEPVEEEADDTEDASRLNIEAPEASWEERQQSQADAQARAAGFGGEAEADAPAEEEPEA